MSTTQMDYKEWLTRLISFDTISPNPHLEHLYLYKKYLAHRTRRQKAAKTSANLLATLSTTRGTLFSSHTEPIHVCDTNERTGCDADAIALNPEFLRMRCVRPMPFHAFASVDERIGCVGEKAKDCTFSEFTATRPVANPTSVSVARIRLFGTAAMEEAGMDYAAQVILTMRDVSNAVIANTRSEEREVPLSQHGRSIEVRRHESVPLAASADIEIGFEFRPLSDAALCVVWERVQSYLHEELIPLMRCQVADAFVEVELTTRVEEGTPHPLREAYMKEESRRRGREVQKQTLDAATIPQLSHI